MKKLLILLAIFAIATPALSVSYRCNYEENGTIYVYKYTPGETVAQHCEIWCDGSILGAKGECKKCKNEEFPRILKAYNTGNCKKFLPAKLYKNIEGCTCKAHIVEDGSYFGHECDGGGSGTCDVDKAMTKMEKILQLPPDER